jgi:hypothetical protein
VTASHCWGIHREQAHSPGRESDDAEILRLTGKHLEALGYQVDLKDPEDVGGPADGHPRCVFLMCEREPVLAELAAWQARGTVLVNSPAAVLATYRERMIAQLAEAGVPFIESRVVDTGARGLEAPGWPAWVKRGDVHNTREGDVVFADSPRVLEGALAALRDRGIRRAVLQPHVRGDLVKFYGIGPAAAADGGPRWFKWFYHKDQAIAGHPFEPARLGRLARRAAAALGLEIYGGDAIATAAGDVVLLDVNAWPSFALYRDEAAAAIAAHLGLRFGGAAR